MKPEPVSVIKPEHSYVPQYDIVWDGAEYLLGRNEVNDFFKDLKALKKKQIIPLGWVWANPYDALETLGINAEPLKQSEYTCPYLKTKHYSVVPTCIIGKSLKAYEGRLREHQKWITNFLFIMKERLDYANQTPSDVSDFTYLMMGSGYTDGTMISDGGPQRVRGMVPLSDGNYLIVFFWEWINK
jgi:hypothetical protein